jgi:DHA2 family multidrug resistance protein
VLEREDAMRSIALLAAAMGCLGVVLKDGPNELWFQSLHIRALSYVAVICLAAFVVRAVRPVEPIDDIHRPML